MTDVIQAAIDRAKAAPVEENLPATTSQNTAVAEAAPTRGRPRSLQDAIDSAGTSVDKWLGVKENGFFLDKKRLPDTEIDAELVLSEVKFGYGVRFDSGGRQNYLKSFDGVVEARSGKSWASVVAEAQRVDPKCRGSYDLADIPMTLRQDLKSSGKDPVSADEGTRIGYTTSVTGYGEFMKFVNKAMKEKGPDVTIPVKLTLVAKTGGGTEYSVMGFDMAE